MSDGSATQAYVQWTVSPDGAAVLSSKAFYATIGDTLEKYIPTITPEPGYQLESILYNSKTYTVDELKAVVLKESDSISYDYMQGIYSFNVTVNLVSNGELLYLDRMGLKHLIAKLKSVFAAKNIITSTTIYPSTWTQESSPTYSDYSWKAEFSVTGVTGSEFVIVRYGKFTNWMSGATVDYATSDLFYPTPFAGAGKVTIYAKSKPTTAVPVTIAVLNS